MKTVGDTTHEYFYNNEVLDMEVIKKNGEVTQYRSYEWDGYTPLGLIVKEKEASGNYQNKTYQYITNQRGDVLSIRDQEDQEVGSYRYDAYGNVLSVEGDVAKDNPIRYAGYYYDEETKNYYLQARYYNPENGAFLALDPHPGDGEEPLSQNGYSYGNNNPVMNIDSNGLKPNRVYYAIMTGILYVANEITGTLKDAYLMGMLLYDSIKGYLDVKKAKKETLTKNASKTIKDSRTLRKVIEKKARKAAKKAGVKAIGKSLGGYYLLYRFSIGVTQGGRNKYFKYAPCYRSAYAYAKYVVKTRLG